DQKANPMLGTDAVQHKSSLRIGDHWFRPNGQSRRRFPERDDRRALDNYLGVISPRFSPALHKKMHLINFVEILVPKGHFAPDAETLQADVRGRLSLQIDQPGVERRFRGKAERHVRRSPDPNIVGIERRPAGAVAWGGGDYLDKRRAVFLGRKLLSGQQGGQPETALLLGPGLVQCFVPSPRGKLPPW